jgi:hypothetical protein
VQKLDIDLCDDTGSVCVQMKGLETQEDKTIFENYLEKSQQNDLTLKSQKNFEIMTFEEVWQEQVLPEPLLIETKTIICFLSNPENQQIMVETIKHLNQQTNVIFISQSTNYIKESQQKYSIPGNDKKTYDDAFKSICEDYNEVDAILYLWPLEDQECIKNNSFIVYILQAIKSAKLKTRRLLLGAQFTNGLDRCYLESWIGYERSLNFVLPNTQVAVIAQEAPEQKTKNEMSAWMQKLWAELQTDKLQSVIYIGGKRQICRIQQTTMQPGSSLLKSGGTYFITGGCGGLGLIFAEYLAKKSNDTGFSACGTLNIDMSFGLSQ